jgi:hypothetical protein
MVQDTRDWAHNPEVGGSNPPPATDIAQVTGPSAGYGGGLMIVMWAADSAGRDPTHMD